jgi:hemerythrin
MSEIDYIQWQPEFLTGIDKIDEGHHHFIKTHNKLVDIINKDICSQKLIEILYALMHYAEHHLINEEICYQGYDGLSEHKVKHKEFINKINDVRKSLEKEQSPAICEKLQQYMNEWFEQHIIKKDKEAVDFVKNNSRK